MNRKESNKVNMYQSVDAVFSRYHDVINEFVPMAEAVARYRETLAVIRQRNSEHQNAAIGVTAAKRVAADKLVEMTLTCSIVLYLYGKKTGNEPLMVMSSLNYSTLDRMRYNQLLDCSTLLAEHAQKYAKEIAPYGFDLDSYNSCIERFKVQSEEQVQKMAEAKAAREELYKAFDATDEILKEELDILLDLVKTKYPDLYNHYQAVRVIKDFGGHSSVKSKEELAAEEAVEEEMEETLVA